MIKLDTDWLFVDKSFIILVLLLFAFLWFTTADAHAESTIRVINNGTLEVRYAESTNAIKIIDLRNGRVYTQSSYPTDDSAILDTDNDELVISTKIKKLDVKIKINLLVESPSEVKIVLSAPSVTKLTSSISFPNRFESKPGESLLIPRGEGQLWPVEDKSFSGWWHVDLNFTGCIDLKTGSGYQIIYETPFDVQTTVTAYRGLMTLGTNWLPSKGAFSYDRIISYRFYDKGGYVAMAKDYKERTKHLGYQIPFSEKVKDRPDLLKLKGAVDLWPMSSDVKTEDFIRYLKLLGIKRAFVSLGTGWQGPDGVADLIDFINSKGYLTSRYDIYTDIWNEADYPPSWVRIDGFPQDIIKGPKGELQKGWVIKHNGSEYQGYYACANTHAAVANARISDDLSINRYNSRFIDVTTASSLYECYDSSHPTTREEDAKARQELLALMSRNFKLVTGSEQSREWAMGVTDFGEGTMSVRYTDNAGYDWMTPEELTPAYAKENSDGALRIPLVSLIYHEGHMSTWYTGDGYQKVPDAWKSKELLNILYGSMPLWMFDGLLWDERKSDFVSSYQNVNTVFEEVAFDELLNHTFLTDDRKVQSTTFSSGVKVYGNFGEKPWVIPPDIAATASFGLNKLSDRALSLGKDGFLTVGTNLFGFRGIADGRQINVVKAKDRIYIDPGDNQGSLDLGCIASDHMAIFHCSDNLAAAKTGTLVVYGGSSGGKAEIKLTPSLLGNGWKLGISSVILLDEYGEPVKRIKPRFSSNSSTITLSIDTEPNQFTILSIKAKL